MSINTIIQIFKRNKELLAKYATFCLFSIVILGIGKQFFYYLEIYNNKKISSATIIRYDESIRSYGIYYEYFVNNQKYEGLTSVSGFRGYNNKKLCIGCEFKVYYSAKDPSKSRICLGEYEKFKRTVEFFNFE